MARRSILTITSPLLPALKATVYRDAEWNEFVVCLSLNGARFKVAADYHTDDRSDAISSAHRMLDDSHGDAVISLADAVADKVDGYMSAYGMGRSRAQVWRAAQNRAFGAGLDHEAE